MISWKHFDDVVYFTPRLLLVGVLMVLLVVMGLGNFDLFEPYLYPLHMAQGRIESCGNGITMGHYPQPHELERLKKERGVDLDISLLNNDLPQERALNAQLARMAQRLGMEFRSYPLPYLGLESPESRRKIEELAAFVRSHGYRKIYIHCYLGRHRVAAVRAELVRQGMIVAGGETEGDGA